MKISVKKTFAAFAILSTILFSTSFIACTTVSVATDPEGEWPLSSLEAQGMQSKVIADMMVDIEESSYHIDSVSIIRNGYMVLDAYLWPASREKKHNIYSCTKSVMSALIGIAIEEGYIKGVHQPITDFFPENVVSAMDDLKKTMTLEHLLTMTSGLDCRDSYRYRWAGLIAMTASKDWARYVLDLPMAATPGEKFEYCNGVSYLLSVILQHATGMRALDFARQHLFGPLGISDIVWDRSPQGVAHGWGDMRLKPHDIAKFGWLYLNKGRWGNRQIIPAAWVAASTRAHVNARLFDQYGYQWWVDSQGFYMAVGYKGQRIFVVPEKNLVTVFTGNLSGRDSLVAQKLLNLYILPAASSPAPLPPETSEQARLLALVRRLAVKPAGIVWASREEGVAQDGVFARTALPAFRFEYPVGSKKTSRVHPAEVMRMKTVGDVEFSAAIAPPPNGMNLEDFGPKLYARELEKYGSGIEILSHRKFTLKCGTPAYRTDIKWMVRGLRPITTLVVSAFKNGKVVFVSAEPPRNAIYAEPIVQSLTFR